MKTTDPPVISEDTYEVSRDLLWSAITDITHMQKWYFDVLTEFLPEVGFTTSFTIENEGRVFPHVWKVLEVESGSLIKYRWTFTNYEGVGDVSFEIFDEGHHCRLRVTNEIIEDYPEGIPEFKRESCQGGWDYFVKQRLKEYLNNLNA